MSRGTRAWWRVIVLPEKLAVMVDPDTEGSDALFQSLTEKTKSTIVVGMVHVSPPAKYNEARVYALGVPVLQYDKHHMLAPFESDLNPAQRSPCCRNMRERGGWLSLKIWISRNSHDNTAKRELA